MQLQDYSQLYQYAQQSPDGHVSPKQSNTLVERLRANPPQSPIKLSQSSRRSKAAAIKHLEELEDDEHAEDEDDASLSKSKGGKRQARRKSLPKASVVVVPREEEEDKSLDGDEDKRAQFLERNRLAACKSRQKKKEWIKSLEIQSEELTRHNGDLQVFSDCSS